MIAALYWQARTMSTEPKVYAYPVIRMVRVTIGSDQLATYLAQMKAFASASGFKVQVSLLSPDPRSIVARMERGDLSISALPISLDLPAAYGFAFHSHRAISAESLDPLVKTLVQLMSQIPGAVIIDETTPAN
jgi:hypothetical protein